MSIESIKRFPSVSSSFISLISFSVFCFFLKVAYFIVPFRIVPVMSSHIVFEIASLFIVVISFMLRFI